LKIYFAGNVGMPERERKNKALYAQRLFSYFYILPGESEHNVFAWFISFMRGMKA